MLATQTRFERQGGFRRDGLEFTVYRSDSAVTGRDLGTGPFVPQRHAHPCHDVFEEAVITRTNV